MTRDPEWGPRGRYRGDGASLAVEDEQTATRPPERRLVPLVSDLPQQRGVQRGLGRLHPLRLDHSFFVVIASTIDLQVIGSLASASTRSAAAIWLSLPVAGASVATFGVPLAYATSLATFGAAAFFFAVLLAVVLLFVAIIISPIRVLGLPTPFVGRTTPATSQAGRYPGNTDIIPERP